MNYNLEFNNVIIFSSYDLYGKDGHCVWYDKCGRDPDYPPSGR